MPSKHLLQPSNFIWSKHNFTKESPGTDGNILFLDTQVFSDKDYSIQTSVHRKPAHTDWYLHWNSNYPISVKNSVVHAPILQS